MEFFFYVSSFIWFHLNTYIVLEGCIYNDEPKHNKELYFHVIANEFLIYQSKTLDDLEKFGLKSDASMQTAGFVKLL